MTGGWLACVYSFKLRLIIEYEMKYLSGHLWHSSCYFMLNLFILRVRWIFQWMRAEAWSNEINNPDFVFENCISQLKHVGFIRINHS